MVARLSIKRVMGIGAFGWGGADGTGSANTERILWSIRRSQIASLEASLAPTYSASVMERAMRDCFLDFYEIAVGRRGRGIQKSSVYP